MNSINFDSKIIGIIALVLALSGGYFYRQNSLAENLRKEITKLERSIDKKEGQLTQEQREMAEIQVYQLFRDPSVKRAQVKAQQKVLGKIAGELDKLQTRKSKLERELSEIDNTGSVMSEESEED